MKNLDLFMEGIFQFICKVIKKHGETLINNNNYIIEKSIISLRDNLKIIHLSYFTIKNKKPSLIKKAILPTNS
jgi:hypothetical protein